MIKVLTLKDAEDLLIFKKIRGRSKKKQVSGSFSKRRLELLYSAIEKQNPAFPYLNEAEKLDYLLYLGEIAMAASGWYPGLKTLDQIEAEQTPEFKADKSNQTQITSEMSSPFN